MKSVIIKTLKLLLATFISIVFCYLAFRDVDIKSVYKIILDIKYHYVLAALLTVVIAQVLRSIRWGVMLRPIEPLNQKLLFPISSVGFMSIVLLPLRLGELVRPYLLNRNSKITMSSGIATIVLERILDSICILALFSITFSSLELPGWILKGVIFFVITVFTLISVLLLGTLRWVNQKFYQIIYKIFPHKLAHLTNTMMESFYQGLHVLGKGRHAFSIILLTASIWGFFVIYYALLLKAFQIHLGMYAALTILVLIALGISVPAGPGFVGNYHFFCVLALSFFGIGKETSLSYALVTHALFIGIFVMLGILSINLSSLKWKIKFSEIFNAGSNTYTNKEI